jgi:squalene-associated FAD-dependent desaturase
VNPVVVIGGGWAGCAAAVELAKAGHRVVVHEAAPTLGGRARCVVRDGLPLDNGEHLLLGAYVDTIDLASSVRDRDEPAAFTTSPLALRPFGARNAQRLSFVTREAPGPLGLLAGLATAGGLGAFDRARLLAWFAAQRRKGWRCDPALTVTELLASQPAVMRDELWQPLCLAALNTPPSRASAQIFLNVLRESFGAGAKATSLVTPQSGLGDAIPEACARWLRARGHDVEVRTRSRVTTIGNDIVGESSRGSFRAKAVVVAVGPHQLAAAFDAGASGDPGVRRALECVAALRYEPITTLYLGYDAAVTLPPGLLRLENGPGQWIFDRSDILRRAPPSGARSAMRALVSVVISASGAHDALDHDALVAATDAQLRSLEPTLPKRVFAQVIAEKRATYAAEPELVRPAAGRLACGVYLAGDYTYGDFPATLEAAVRSGRIAAAAVNRDFAATAAARDSIRAP